MNIYLLLKFSLEMTTINIRNIYIMWTCIKIIYIRDIYITNNYIRDVNIKNNNIEGIYTINIFIKSFNIKIVISVRIAIIINSYSKSIYINNVFINNTSISIDIVSLKVNFNNILFKINIKIKINW